MNLEREHWSLEDYQEYSQYLRGLSDSHYRDFTMKLTPTKYEVLGIRMPVQRKIAKEIRKGNWQEFLLYDALTFEELNIKGFVMALQKEWEIVLPYLTSYIKRIDNWATCDSFCNSLKLVLKYREDACSFIQVCLRSEHEFTVRVGLVLLLCYYMEEEYIDGILELISDLKREEYYINMAYAWLLAESYLVSKNKTIAFLQSGRLNSFTRNKTISKICDSYRVSEEEKNYLKEWKKSLT